MQRLAQLPAYASGTKCRPLRCTAGERAKAFRRHPACSVLGRRLKAAHLRQPLLRTPRARCFFPQRRPAPAFGVAALPSESSPEERSQRVLAAQPAAAEYRRVGTLVPDDSGSAATPNAGAHEAQLTLSVDNASEQ